MDYKKKYLKYKLKYLNIRKFYGGAQLSSKKNLIENFFKAIENNNLDDVKALLNQDHTLVDIARWGMTGLMLAAREGHVEVVEELLGRRGAYVDIQNRDGWTALMYAAASGHDAVVAALLDHGADIYTQNSDGMTALLLAVEKRYNNIRVLLEHARAELERAERAKFLQHHKKISVEAA